MLALWASRGTIGGMLVIASKSFIDSIERDDEAVVKTWEDVLRERKATFKGHDEVVCFGGPDVRLPAPCSGHSDTAGMHAPSVTLAGRRKENPCSTTPPPWKVTNGVEEAFSSAERPSAGAAGAPRTCVPEPIDLRSGPDLGRRVRCGEQFCGFAVVWASSRWPV